MSDDLARTWPSDPAYPPRQASPGHLVGRVADLQIRHEGGGDSVRRTVLSFRVSAGTAGTAMREVEVRGFQLNGSVRDGDWIEVADKKRQGLIHANHLENLTTGATVSNGPTTRAGRTVMITLLVLFALFFLAVVGFIVHGMLTMDSFLAP